MVLIFLAVRWSKRIELNAELIWSPQILNIYNKNGYLGSVGKKDAVLHRNPVQIRSHSHYIGCLIFLFIKYPSP